MEHHKTRFDNIVPLRGGDNLGPILFIVLVAAATLNKWSFNKPDFRFHGVKNDDSMDQRTCFFVFVLVPTMATAANSGNGQEIRLLQYNSYCTEGYSERQADLAERQEGPVKKTYV